MKRTQAQVKGTAFVAVSALFFASYGIWSKLMTGFFAEFNQAWIRALLILTILLPIGILKKKFKKIAKADLIWFILVSLSGGLNQAPYYYAFEQLEVGVATTLFYASLTIGGLLFGKLFFKEKITPIKIASLIMALIGMGLVYGLKISGGILPLALAILAGLMGSAEVVLSKKISNKYPTIQVLSFTFATMLLCNLLISTLLREPLPSLTLNQAWLGQLGYSTSMLIAFSAVVIGLKYIEASVGALVGLLEIVFATLFGVIFFQEVLSMGILAGSGSILLAAALPELWALKKR